MPAEKKSTLLELRNAIHYSRWKRIKDGSSIEKVAEEDGVKPDTVRNSYLTIETYKNIYSMPQLETAQIQMVLELQEDEKVSLKQAFNAKVRSSTPYGIIETPDHDTALAASHVLTERISALQPRKGITVSTNVSTGVAVASDGNVSFEGKLRNILQKREQEKLPPPIEVTALAGGQDDADIDE